MRARTGTQTSLALLAATAAAALLVLAGCGSDEETTSTSTSGSTTTSGSASTTTASPEDTATVIDALKGTVTVQAGSTLQINLDSNPTTGYEWVLGRKPDAAVLRFQGKDYEQDPGTEGQTGAGGTETLTFKAIAPGKTPLELQYLRSFDDPPKPAETQSGTVVIE